MHIWNLCKGFLFSLYSFNVLFLHTMCEVDTQIEMGGISAISASNEWKIETNNSAEQVFSVFITSKRKLWNDMTKIFFIFL